MVINLLLFAAASVAGAEETSLQRYQDVRPAMGSTFEIVLYAADKQVAADALDAAYERIDALNMIFSDYDTDSESNRLCRQAPMSDPVPISCEMCTVLQAALSWSQRSQGAFDVTVGPMTRLWRRARRQKRMPSDSRLEEARTAVGYQFVKLDSDQETIQLTGSGMRMDFGGIAKGYACDQALIAMREHGVTRALINGGGDVTLGDPPPAETGWKVGVAPLKPDDPPSQILRLANCAVATSGDAWQFVEIDGRRFSHIVDPRTGLGIERRSSVTVLAPDGISADALASVVSILGPEKGICLVDLTPDTACLVVTVADGEVAKSVSKRFDAVTNPEVSPSE